MEADFGAGSLQRPSSPSSSSTAYDAHRKFALPPRPSSAKPALGANRAEPFLADPTRTPNSKHMSGGAAPAAAGLWGDIERSISAPPPRDEMLGGLATATTPAPPPGLGGFVNNASAANGTGNSAAAVKWSDAGSIGIGLNRSASTGPPTSSPLSHRSPSGHGLGSSLSVSSADHAGGGGGGGGTGSSGRMASALATASEELPSQPSALVGNIGLGLTRPKTTEPDYSDYMYDTSEAISPSRAAGGYPRNGRMGGLGSIPASSSTDASDAMGRLGLFGDRAGPGGQGDGSSNGHELNIGLGIRRPASTGIMPSNDHAGPAASDEVMKSLGLFASTLRSNEGSHTAGAGGAASSSAAVAAPGMTSANAGSSNSGSALMELLQEEARKSASPIEPASSNPAVAGVDGIGNGMRGMNINSGTASAGVQRSNSRKATAVTNTNSIRYEPVSASSSRHGPPKQSAYAPAPAPAHYHQQHQPQYGQEALYGNYGMQNPYAAQQYSPQMMGHHPGTSPPEYMLGPHGASPTDMYHPHGVSPHGASPPDMYHPHQRQYTHNTHQAPSRVAAAAAAPSAAAQTVYYTQGPQGQPQAVYINAPPPPPHHAHAAGPYGHHVPPPPPHGYGYATIQYHTGPPPPQGAPPVPGATHAYAYYPSAAPPPYPGAAAGAPGAPHQQTVTIMNAHGQPTQIAVAPHLAAPQATTASSSGPSPRRGPSNGRSGGRSSRGPSGGTRRTDSRGMDTSGGSGTSRRSNNNSGPSDPMLDEFRASKSTMWNVTDIKGHVVAFCKDQNGSRFIQQRLEVAGSDEKDIVMEEVMPGLVELCGDVFGNYVVQKLLELGDTQMRGEIFNGALKGQMLNLSMQMYGCRVVQKAFETLENEQLSILLDEFRNNVVDCIHDQNGNHVMQKCVEVMSSKAKRAESAGDRKAADDLRDLIQFLIDAILADIAPLSCHPYGCRVLQRILEHCVEPQKTDILDALQLCHRTLLDDQYGNYVIQHVLQYGRVSDRQSILEIVVDNCLLSLSRQKFASNVVEKLLKYGSPQQRNGVVRAMLKKVHDDSIPTNDPEGVVIVILMVRDAYANYVVQTAIDVVPEGEERRELLQVLQANVSLLRQYTFAKHIVNKLGTS